MAEHDGGCLCGAVRYATTADPQRVVMCHCHFCQKGSGAPYAIEVFFRREDFRVLAGAPTVYEHRSTGSGKTLAVNFCGRCGTRLFTGFERYPEMMSVFGTTFDEPEWFERSETRRHVFLSSARTGTVIPPGIDSYPEGSFAPDGTPNAPQVFATFHVIGRQP